MFSRTHFAIFILILIVFGYLFYLNPGEVNFILYEDYTLSISPALIAFGAFIIGSFFVFLVTLFVDAKRAFDLWRSSKRERREGVVRERYSDALEQMLKGNIARAKEMLAKIIEKRPQHLPAFISLANLNCLEGKHGEAIDILIRAKIIDPENLELLFDLAKNYRSLKEYTLAVETLDQILERDAANREALRKKREIFIEERDWSQAYQTQKDVVKHTKEKEELLAEKKILMGLEFKFAEDLAQRGNFKEAEKTLRAIIKEDREFLPPYVVLGDVLQRLGSPDEASQIWGKALETFWNPIFLERLEALYLSMATPQKALHFYHEYVRQRPEDTVLRFFFCRLLIRLEMIDEALEQLRELETSGTS
ncbi:MAG: tetratricopeptide repeat protein, partial [Deltaproteobacteria bacterium]|nr:tetratricopeptide repeat protein [Deltaproteobacteria bacterium]